MMFKKMKGYYALIILLFLANVCVATTSAHHSLELSWEMGANSVVKNTYENTFYLINHGNETLDKDWIIYFNQAHAQVVLSDSTLVVEQIGGSYYKLYPSTHYIPIEKGDTLKFTFRCRGSIMKTSQAPEGVYIVQKNKDGVVQQPADVKVSIRPFMYEYQWSRKDKPDLPYPYGEKVYEENKQLQVIELHPADIFPTPKEIIPSLGNFVFSKDVQILSKGTRFQAETDYLKKQLQEQHGCIITKKATTHVTIKEVQAVHERQDAYHLVFNNNHVLIEAASASGVFYASQTLLNILGTNQLPFTMANVQINDYADLAHRGFMLDVARNFTKKEHVFKLIDVLSSYKLNVLHLHLTDDEGWRIEIPGLEELTSVGAFRGHTLDEKACLYPAYGGGWNSDETNNLGSGFYTKEDFIAILKYADQHHMRVIPEIDLPGHARAAIKAMETRYHKYKESNLSAAKEYLLSDFNDTSIYRSAQAYTDNAICVALPSVYTFVEKITEEIRQMYVEAGLKLDAFHIGGDEVPAGAWTGSDVCKDFMKKENMQEVRQLKDYFVQRVYQILTEKDMQLLGWQELALLPDKTANPLFKDANLLSYCWSTSPDRKSDQIPYKLANAGYPIILSNVNNFYFDLSYSKHEDEPGAYWAAFLNEVNSFDMLPYNVYKSVRKDLSGQPRDYQSDIKNKEALTNAGRNQIKGIQGQLWTETIRSYDMVEYYLFPKMYGLIERAWNTTPSWEQEAFESKYAHELGRYQSKIITHELKRLYKKAVNFRISQPGIKIIDGKIHANCVYKNAEIRYTLDGSEPTMQSPIWTNPVVLTSHVTRIKAKTFYLNKESVASLLLLE